MREGGKEPDRPPQKKQQSERKFSAFFFLGGAVTDHGAECRGKRAFLTENVLADAFP